MIKMLAKMQCQKICMLQSIKLCQFKELKQILSSVKILQKYSKELKRTFIDFTMGMHCPQSSRSYST